LACVHTYLKIGCPLIGGQLFYLTSSLISDIINIEKERSKNMSTFSIISIGLWCVLIGLNGANAALQYNNGDIFAGIIWTVGAVLWAAAIILRVVHPA
jgi:hypothetical protein